MIHNALSETISLDGLWDFTLGDGQPGQIRTPGSWESQGFPKLVAGPAHYRKEVVIPVEWTGTRILAEFEAVSYATRLRVNGRDVGEHLGMWTPFAFDITAAARLGDTNLIEVKVHKPGGRYPVGATLAGFLPDVGLPFGGIWKPARLRALQSGLRDVSIRAHPGTGTISVTCSPVSLVGPPPDALQVVVSRDSHELVRKTTRVVANHEVSLDVDVPDFALWSPETPVLYNVELRLLRGDTLLATMRERTGFRQLSASGQQILLNGRPICLRGALHWGWDPDTFTPDFTVEQVREELRVLRDLGFNMVKHCLVIPSRTYYDVADEEGMLLWQEMPLWNPAHPLPEAMRQAAPGEYKQYMQLTHFHPSIVVYSLGCELRTLDQRFIGELDGIVRGEVDYVLFCDNSGSSEIWSGGLVEDFADFSDYHIYSDIHDFEPLLDHYQRDWTRPRPWLSGEFNDSDTFRDLHEIIEANGGVRPWWLTEDIPAHTWRPEVRALIDELELLEKADLQKSPEELTKISYAQSLTVRKYVLESVRRRAATGGYVITGIRDTPLFTAGIFDDLGRPKWTPEEFKPFNQDAVLTYDVDRASHWPIHSEHLDRRDRACFWAGDTIRLHMILHNCGQPLDAAREGCRLAWQLRDLSGDIVLDNAFDLGPDQVPGRPQAIGSLLLKLPHVDTAREYVLHARITGCGADEIANSWPLWSFPPIRHWPRGIVVDDPAAAFDPFPELMAHAARVDGLPEMSPRLVVSSALSPWTVAYLKQGGRVLLLQQGTAPLPARRGPFWREALKLFYPHPLWQRFPHRGYTDMQFFGLSTEVMLELGCMAQYFGEAVEAETSLMKRLDAREFYVHDYMIEGRVGKGRLLACTLRLQGGDGAQATTLARNIAGYALLHEMIRYLAGTA